MREMKLANGCSSPLATGRVTRLKLKSLLACVKSYVASNMAASSPGLRRVGQRTLRQDGTTKEGKTYSSLNNCFAVSASTTGFGGGLPPGAMALRPIMLRVVANVQPSGRSS